MGEKVLAAKHEQLGGFAGGGVGGSRLAIEHRDFAEQIAGSLKVQRQTRAVRGAGFNANLAAPDPEQRVALVAFLKQHLASSELLGMAQAGNPLQFVGTEVGEHRIHFENNRELSLGAHERASKNQDLTA